MFSKKIKIKIANVLVASLILGFTSNINFNTIKVFAAELPGAHHAAVENDVFLGGNYLEVGVNKHGSFGTAIAAPTGFHPVSRTNLGMVVDGDGFEIGEESKTGDFFLPGSPYESYVVAYKNSEGISTKAQVAERSGMLGITNISTTDTSSGNTLSATTVGTTNDGKLKITQVVSFDVNDKYFNIHVTYENISESTLYDARYLRSVDPDQDADKNLDYTTKNSVIKNPPQDAKAIVIAKGNVTDEPFVYMASDSRARASVTRMTDPYNEACYQEDGSNLLKPEALGDTWIAMTFDLGDIEPGKSVSLDFINSLNPDLDSALNSGVTETTPAAVEITRDEDTLTAKLKKEDGTEYTTSAAVAYDWYRNDELVQTGTENIYVLTDADKGKEISVKIDKYELKSEPLYIEKGEAPETPETTPAAVTIEGKTRVGETLTAQLIDENENDFTTSGAVTYKWYRLNSSNSEFSNEIGTGKTYKLKGADLKKYIGVQAIYNEYEFSDKVGKISKSSSSSSSSNNSSTDTSIESTNTSSTSTTDTSADSNKTGWIQDTNSKWYLVKEDGTKTTGWKLLEDKWYFFDKDSGSMITGWYKAQNGEWTYDGQDTVGQWFYLDGKGKMVTGWFKDIDGSWYFLCDGKQYGALGVMKTGWQQIDGKWYFFNNNGTMASDTVVEGYTLGSDGAWIK
ncbi:toxin A [Clostridium puniceum]|uniref:Toxin A n=1 Tax=Clostridium puniceum TaxID=29367 RepID=A0A1S8TN64_9CLOT|nr:N-acetylmuramoyl-L-alanine amidase family protein [Clostridium puniceum]OOM79042.1 toxin A [Clostridium puniceum]